MEVNFLGLVATAMAVFVPTAFLLIMYIQTASRDEEASNR